MIVNASGDLSLADGWICQQRVRDLGKENVPAAVDRVRRRSSRTEPCNVHNSGTSSDYPRLAGADVAQTAVNLDGGGPVGRNVGRIGCAGQKYVAIGVTNSVRFCKHE